MAFDCVNCCGRNHELICFLSSIHITIQKIPDECHKLICWWTNWHGGPLTCCHGDWLAQGSVGRDYLSHFRMHYAMSYKWSSRQRGLIIAVVRVQECDVSSPSISDSQLVHQLVIPN